MFPALNLNPQPLKIIKRKGEFMIWDIWRKKYIQLSPEEWVRQQLLHNLTNEYDYPAQRIAVEMQIEINGLTRRCDAVVFDFQGSPQMIIECKAPNVELSPNVLHQIAQYNVNLRVSFLLISNGLRHFTLKLGSSFEAMTMNEALLNYDELNEF
jgi:hypothetical protein